MHEYKKNNHIQNTSTRKLEEDKNQNKIKQTAIAAGKVDIYNNFHLPNY